MPDRATRAAVLYKQSLSIHTVGSLLDSLKPAARDRSNLLLAELRGFDYDSGRAEGEPFPQAVDFLCWHYRRFRGNVCSEDLLSGQRRVSADNAVPTCFCAPPLARKTARSTATGAW